MSHVKLGSAPARPLHDSVEGYRCDDRTTVGAKPWDVGDPSLIRGFAHIRIFVRGFPCLRTGVDLAIGLRAPSGVPLPWLRPRRCTRLSSPDRCPGMAPWKGVERVALPLPRKTPYLAAAWALLTSRLMAQMKAASSRATAVTATVFNLPFLISAR